MINFEDENKDKLNENISFDVMLEKEIEKIKDAKYKCEKYIGTCEGMIKHYKKKIKTAKDKFESLEEIVQQNILNFLKAAINEKTIPINLLDQTNEYIKYTLPTCGLIISKRRLKIKDYDKLYVWLLSNYPDYIIEEKKIINTEEFEKLLSVDENNNIIITSTGEIMNKYYSLTDIDINIKFFK